MKVTIATKAPARRARLHTAIGIITGALLLASPADAKDKPELAKSPLLQQLLACRDVAGEAERLQCFDKATANVAAAAARNDVYVVDRSQMQATRRSLFGLPLPRLNIFSDSSDDKEAVTRLEGVVQSASQGGDGNWLIRLADGSVWRQSDGVPLGFLPKSGQKVVINRAAFGSYKMSIDGRAGVRARRVS